MLGTLFRTGIFTVELSHNSPLRPPCTFLLQINNAILNIHYNKWRSSVFVPTMIPFQSRWLLADLWLPSIRLPSRNQDTFTQQFLPNCSTTRVCGILERSYWIRHQSEEKNEKCKYLWSLHFMEARTGLHQAPSSSRERGGGEEGKEVPDTPCYPTCAYRAVILLFFCVPSALIQGTSQTG